MCVMIVKWTGEAACYVLSILKQMSLSSLPVLTFYALLSSSHTFALVVGTNMVKSPENPNVLLQCKVKQLVSLRSQSQDSKQQLYSPSSVILIMYGFGICIEKQYQNAVTQVIRLNYDRQDEVDVGDSDL